MKDFRALLNEWNQLLREDEENSFTREERWFLRFGDPRKVSGTVSMIHDPGVTQDKEEYFYSPEGPRLQQYEKGISAYFVNGEPSPERVSFRVGVGIQTFRSQLSGFLFDRLLTGDVWIFKAVPTGTFGTDDEPLVDKDSINSVTKTDADIFVAADVGMPEFRVFDLLDPWDLKSEHDMGVHEFFGKNVGREELESYLENLYSKFTTPQQKRAIDGIKEVWEEELEEM